MMARSTEAYATCRRLEIDGNSRLKCTIAACRFSEDSLYQDASIQALQSRGVRFVSCHTSVEEAARGFIKQDGLFVEPEEVAKDMVERALQGVIIVPSLAAALDIFQCEGHYSYMAA